MTVNLWMSILAKNNVNTPKNAKQQQPKEY